MSDSYWIRTPRGVSGPYSPRELKRLARDGEFSMADEVSGDRQRWLTAGRVKGLQFGEAVLQLEGVDDQALAASFADFSPAAISSLTTSQPIAAADQLWDELPKTPKAPPPPPPPKLPPEQTEVVWGIFGNIALASAAVLLFCGLSLGIIAAIVGSQFGMAWIGGMVLLGSIALTGALFVLTFAAKSTIALEPLDQGAVACTVINSVLSLPVRTIRTTVRSGDFLRLSSVRMGASESQPLVIFVCWFFMGIAAALMYDAMHQWSSTRVMGTLRLETADLPGGVVLWKRNVDEFDNDFKTAPEEVKRLYTMLARHVKLRVVTDTIG